MQKKIIAVVALTLLFFSTAAFAHAAQTVTLKTGFNFISFTVAISMTAVQFKELSPAIDDVYQYSAAAGSFLSANEGTLGSLAAGKGYIVKSNATANIPVEVPGGALSTIGNINLKSGFNLVGLSKLPAAITFSQLMTANSFVNGIYKWSPSTGSFIQVVREGGVPVQLDGMDPSLAAGEAYFFNLSQDVQINYDGTGILMGTNITPPVVNPTENPFAGTYSGTFNGTYGSPQGPIVITVTTQGVLNATGTNNSNVPPTTISGTGTVTSAGDASFSVKLTNYHKYTGTFTSSGASGNFYETDGVTVKGTWQVTKTGGSK